MTTLFLLLPLPVEFICIGSTQFLPTKESNVLKSRQEEIVKKIRSKASLF